MNRKEADEKMRVVLGRAVAPKFEGTVSDWAEEFLSFNEPGRVGKFSLHQRQYLREPLDGYGLDDVTDEVLCFGTRTGKTTILFAGEAYRLQQKARRVLWVKPTGKGAAGAENDAKTRFIPMLRASPELAKLIPSGAMRHNFRTAQQMLLNGSIIDWAGSNSVGQLASNSCEDVIQDETDKFNSSRRKNADGDMVEANACDLADERTGEFRFCKRVKASTPTLVSGRIWCELLNTDLRRRFVPCPLCGRDHPSSKLVVLAWSKQFTVLPKTFGYGTSYEPESPIPLAYAQWDDEARRADGTWDLERVEKSAGYQCPHCGGRFRDDDKGWMDANGVWVPTQRGALRTRGYHLPSMYASHEQTTAGKLALGFLEAIRSVEGPQNVVNSKLAEPYSLEGVSANRVGMAAKQIEVSGEWLKILSADYHQNAPYFWAIVRAWNGSDKTHGIEYQSFNQWSDLDQFQAKHKIIPQAVIIDVGFSQSEVLQECANIKLPSRCSLADSVQGAPPECVGWNPAKSFGGKRLWKDEATGLLLPYRIKKDVDPYAGSELAHMMRIELLEFTSDLFEDMLDNIRRGATGMAWTIAPEMDTEVYHRHMAGKIRKRDPNNAHSYKWDTVRRGVDDHLHVCELMSFVLAYRLQLISFSAIQSKSQTPMKNHDTAEISGS